MAVFYVILFGIVHLGFFNQASYVTPKILDKPDNKDDVIINAGSDFNLTCQGSQPLKWTYPKMDEKDFIMKNKTHFEIVETAVPHNDDYIHRSVLYIRNMAYPFVGYYTCVYYDGDEAESDNIYLYVNDPDHLSVEDNFRVYYAVQYQEAVIPCRPTSPDIHVELQEPNSIETEYNPKIGFTFFVNDVRYQDNYFCNFTRPSDDNTIVQTFFLMVTTPRLSLAKPYIEDISNNHTEVGGNLTLKCYVQEETTNIGFEWGTPRGPTNGKNTITETIDGKKYLVKKLHIANVTHADSGLYTCRVSDRQNHTNENHAHIFIQDKDTCFIHIRETRDQYNLTVEEGETVQWVLKVIAHPVPVLKWYDSKEKEIKNSSQYYIEELSDNNVLFKINNVSLENNGVYTLRSRCPWNGLGHQYKTTEVHLTLYVFTTPTLTLNSQKVYLRNNSALTECTAIGNPIPKISWLYNECITETECQNVLIKDQRDITAVGFKKKSVFTLTPQYNGNITCYASNSLGSREETVQIYISDVKDGFDIYNYDADTTVKRRGGSTEIIIATNYPLNFTCAVSPYKARDLHIFHNNTVISGTNDGYLRITVPDEMSIKTTISLKQATFKDSGVYSCQVQNKDNGKYEFRNITVSVKDPQPPKIIATNLHDVIKLEYPKMAHKFYCNYTGIPKVTIQWYKADNIIHPSERIIFEDDDTVLKFLSTQVSDEGLYRCKIYNDFGQQSMEAMLKFEIKPVSLVPYYYVIGAVLILLLGAIIYIIIKKRKEKKLRHELKLLGLENFHKGNPEHINPELGIDDQAELLPYDKKWEFPIEQLKLGKQLGSGAFGVVMKAEAIKLIQGEDKTTVAVKMVKKNADQTYIKALASELKIMVHLGKHLNVVNLLGACTKNVAKKELMVIVEFCRFGNLQNYLYKHRESFINQVDPRSGTIDYNIGSQVLDRLYSISSDNGSTVTTPYSMQDYREKERNTAMTSGVTQVTSLGEDQVQLSNNSIQPEWRTNYRGDYRGDVKPVSTRDLITWSFQIARGMDYLASRKVLHGDLAARNILLADSNVVKICDFGLAKTMYNDNNYKKKGNSPLPIKWMAIESIRDRVFSTQSDVWSFGIVLWELFSLAKTPYPGMEADERLYYKLVEGYRMEPPIYTPRQIHIMMADCWQSKPLARPSFTMLVERIGQLLEDSVKKHYVDLNDPYLVMNTQKLEGQDYLAMVSPPSFDLLSTPSPHYVNEGVTPVSAGSKSPEGYTFMGANTIFSPRLHDNEVFDFNMGKRRLENSQKENQELYPMLHSNNESDSESGYLRPISPIISISNPTYHLPPTVLDPPDTKKDLFKSPDNYITMPQYKNIVSKQTPVQIDATKNCEKARYVNSEAEMWDSIDV